VFAALLAPLLFDRILEYPIAVALALTLLPATKVLGRDARGQSVVTIGVAVLAGAARVADFDGSAFVATVVAAILAFALFRKSSAFAVILVVLIAGLLVGDSANLATVRTFFGVHRVYEISDGVHAISSGTTVHGSQTMGLSPPLPTGYYHRSGPVGQVITAVGQEPEVEVALIGLGAGTLAAYSRPGDTYTFFEIDPAVVELATDPDLFTYISDAEGSIEFVLGDGRIMLDRQTKNYDAIVMDAFSSDAIPTHLVTRGAVAVYLEHLNPDGLLAVHISNRHLDLEPVLGRLANDADLVALSLSHQPTEAAADEGATPSLWVVMARSAAALEALPLDEGWQAPPNDGPLWTDSYTSLLSVFRWG